MSDIFWTLLRVWAIIGLTAGALGCVAFAVMFGYLAVETYWGPFKTKAKFFVKKFLETVGKVLRFSVEAFWFLLLAITVLVCGALYLITYDD